ncbi:unnamed protein product [Arabis nemorensis]|uniref:Uncharacterized protein n=1 Tax=Arabis nemorensis TaxID=586526 RepID=A0A565BEG0_9BRAS|nr:unnamed protein product [Arabis nemorensis]
MKQRFGTALAGVVVPKQTADWYGELNLSCFLFSSRLNGIVERLITINVISLWTKDLIQEMLLEAILLQVIYYTLAQYHRR